MRLNACTLHSYKDTDHQKHYKSVKRHSVEKSLGVGYNVILFTQKLIELRGKAAKLQRSQISNNSMLLSFIYHVYNIC
jgi:hypothetical protein